MSVLFVASEAYPLVKTGGLADVAGALPAALAKAGEDVRIMLPAYPQALDGVLNKCDGRSMGDPFGIGEVKLIEAQMPDSGVPVYLVDCPPLYQRDGGLYQQVSGEEWPDNHARFALLSQIAARVSNPKEGGDWNPDLLHINDWQCGLTPAYQHYYGILGVKTVFTIHNLRYQGQFDPAILQVIALPKEAYGVDGIEFHGSLSYMKAGIFFSDIITTVSRTYAREIQTPEYGYGIEGLLKVRSNDLHGIVNGIDYDIWNPATDTLIEKNYTVETLADKQQNKKALQAEMGLPIDENAPLLGFVGRLTEQKGVDLIAENLQYLMSAGAQLVLLGTGDKLLEEFLGEISSSNEYIKARIMYDEDIAHRIIAGCDMFLMPSRFEPCGLTQMYALRYGTLPIVRRTGGLNDTVNDLNEGEGADGFVFDVPVTAALNEAIKRAIETYEDKNLWHRLQTNAMNKDFSWDRSAQEYIELYKKPGGREV
jgi:starch synthase